jgi:hypothetical protein
MKFALTAFAAAALATMTALPAQAATIVNLNGVANASLTGTNGVKVTLDAGTYNLSFLNSPNLQLGRGLRRRWQELRSGLGKQRALYHRRHDLPLR